MILPADQVERFAIRAALGNNGGQWATHYSEDQKNHWRRFVIELASQIEAAPCPSPPATALA